MDQSTAPTPERETKNAVFSSGEDNKTQNQPSRRAPTVPTTGDLGFELAAETVPLPSSGVVYPATSPLHRAETVQIRPMTSREEDILTSRALVKNGTVISKLVESCLVDKRINVKEMLSGDVNAVMVAIRITGYGSRYEARIKCPTCDKPFDHTVDLSQLAIKRMTIEPIEVGCNLFSATLPRTGAQVLFKFATAGDDITAIVDAEAKKKANLRENNIVTSKLVSSIVSINGREERGFVSRFVTQMPAQDSKFLRKLVSDNEPGVDMRDRATCTDPDCEASEVVPIPVGAAFFWPDD